MANIQRIILFIFLFSLVTQAQWFDWYYSKGNFLYTFVAYTNSFSYNSQGFGLLTGDYSKIRNQSGVKTIDNQLLIYTYRNYIFQDPIDSVTVTDTVYANTVSLDLRNKPLGSNFNYQYKVITSLGTVSGSVVSANSPNLGCLYDTNSFPLVDLNGNLLFSQ